MNLKNMKIEILDIENPDSEFNIEDATAFRNLPLEAQKMIRTSLTSGSFEVAGSAAKELAKHGLTVQDLLAALVKDAGLHN